MDELRSILERLGAGAGQPACALATLVYVEGSSYRGVGARALALPDGNTVGLISGGCLEGDLLERAGEVLADGRPRTVRYDSTAPEDALLGLGLGCNGVVEVLLERVTAADARAADVGAIGGRYLPLLQAARAAGRRSALATVYRSPEADEVGSRLALIEPPVEAPPAGPGAAGPGQGRRPASAAPPAAPGVTPAAPETHRFGPLRATLQEAVTRDLAVLLNQGRSRAAAYQVAGAPVQVLLELVEPPLALTVCGAGPDAQPLVTLAAGLGWEPVVFDHRAAFARPQRFPGAARVVTAAREEFSKAVPPRAGEVAVLMTHSYPTDLAYLEQLAPRNLRYLGVLGPRRRLERLLAELGPRAPAAGVLYGPAGLDIGADTPAEIALAIAAEIRAVLTRRGGGSLRARPTPIHETRDAGVAAAAGAFAGG